MRIGVNCFLLQPNIGGMKAYFAFLFEWLLEFDRENTYIFFHFPQNAGELAKLRSNRWRQNAIALDSQEAVARHWDSIDLYFCPFGAIWPRPTPIPSVVTVHDIQERFFPDFFDVRQHYERESHFPSSTQAADRVITVSHYTKKTVVDHHGVPEQRITVAHSCADPLYFRAGEAGLLLDEELPFERFVFFPANRWLHKNHDLLLRALRYLKRERGLIVNAVFTGLDVDGGYPLFAKAAEYDVADQVHSVGYITQEQMAHLYTRAEMLVFPSLFEGFGLPVVEAMAAGCPCAISSSTSLPEIAGDAALYFDPDSVEAAAEAIAKLWNDQALRERMTKKGRVRAAAFSIEATAAAHLEAFAEAAASFSRLRYWWQSYVHQPLHQRRVERKYRDKLGQPTSMTDSPDLTVRFGSGWHNLEGSDADWLRWSSGAGELILQSPAALEVRIEGATLSMQRPNVIRVDLNGAEATRWEETAEASGFRPFPPLDLRLQEGRNRIRILSGNKPVQGAHDPRPLAVAVKNLFFRSV